MTNTDTADIAATVRQIVELVDAGSELVRLTVMNGQAADAIPRIRDQLLSRGVMVPLIGDFHFNGHRLLQDYPACAEALDKYRINPGNVGKGARKDIQFAQMIETACRYDKPVRIGVNWGSLDPQFLSRAVEDNNRSVSPLTSEALIERVVIQSALESARFAEQVGLPADHIVISCKLSEVQALIRTYESLAQQCQYALHVGLTEAGMGLRGVIASTAALAVLLQKGIGDTIRMSLTPTPGAARSEEVTAAWTLLQAMGIRAYRPDVIACPGCGRTRGGFYQQLAQQVQMHIEKRLPEWRRQYRGIETLTVAVMGCIVNGPGESRQANIGISLPGTDETLGAPVYADGQRVATLKDPGLAEAFLALLDEYVATTFGSRH